MSRTEVEIEREYGPFRDEPRIHGVSFDGEQVWFASGKKLQAFDAQSGKPTHALEIPSDAGVAFDGKHLYQLADGQIHQVDPKTGQILATISAPSPEGNSGLAWAEGSLWLGRGSEGKIVELDPKTGKILSTVFSDRFVTGVTFSDGELWHGTLPDQNPEHDRSELYRVDRSTSEVLERLALPEGITCTGLESDGKGRFYCGGGKSGKIRVVRQPKRTASSSR